MSHTNTHDDDVEGGINILLIITVVIGKKNLKFNEHFTLKI